MCTKDVSLRSFERADLDFILALEADTDVGPYIRPWTRAQHVAAQSDSQLSYLIARDAERRVGFVILRHSAKEPNTVEFVRLAIAARRRGYGRSTVAAVVKFARDTLRLNSVWLEVFPQNAPALRLYASQGFDKVGQQRTDNGFGGLPGQVIRMSRKL